MIWDSFFHRERRRKKSKYANIKEHRQWTQLCRRGYSGKSDRSSETYVGGNGHFVILFMAWLPNDSEIAAHSEEFILKYNPNWNGAHLAPDKEKRQDMSEITPDWAQGLFKTEKWIEYEINLNFTRESWHGRMRACRGIDASTLSEEDIAAWEEEHLKYLKTMPESFNIPHWITILNLLKVQEPISLQA